LTADIAFDESGLSEDEEIGQGIAGPTAGALIVRIPAPLGANATAVKTWFDEIVEAEAPVLDGSLAAEREAAEAYARMAKAENTRRAYRAAGTARISYTRMRKVPGSALARPVWPGARGSKSGTAR